jgi:hypothetical protein
MKYGPSTFYANFLLAELVRKNKSVFFLDHPASGMGTGGGSMVMGGGGGGSIGSGTARSGSRESQYQKTESYSFQKELSREADQLEFFSSLKLGLEDEIVRSGGQVTHLEPTLGGFSVEYIEEGIHGKIEITGEASPGNYYTLTASLAEISTSQKKPVIKREPFGRKPQGTYAVVAFLTENLEASAPDFSEIGQRALRDSVEVIMQKLRADYSTKDSLLKSLEYAEVYSWSPMPLELKQRFEEVMGVELNMPAEYEQFAAVYFLNETAVKLYRDAEVVFEIWKSIPADEVPKIPGPFLRGPYLPKGNSA